MANDRPSQGIGSWKVRRRFMFAVTAFCMACVMYILYKNLESSVAETTITMAFFCLSTIVGSYVFGATWQDINMAKSKEK